MKYIYLGTAVSDNQLNSVFSKYAHRPIVYVQQKWDYIFCEALQSLCGDNFYAISYPPVQTFPAGKGFFISRMPITGVNGIIINEINLPVVKQYCCMKTISREILKYSEKYPDEEIRVITHTTYLQSIRAVNRAKEKCDRIKLFSMVPDLPEYSTGEKVETGNVSRRLFKKYQAMSASEKHNVDGYICFSEMQMEVLNKEKPHIVMEGFVSDTMFKNVDAEPLQEKVFLYAGNLKKNSGVDMLAQAFLQLDLQDTELWICGEGELKEKLKSLSSDKIKLLGVLKREEVLKLEKQVSLLINPRPIGEQISRYAFPSKLLEFMSSGTPVLTTHLPCIPKEYDEYLNYIEEDTIEGFVDGFNNLENSDKAIRARIFVEKKKNVISQAKRVVEFVSVY